MPPSSAQFTGNGSAVDEMLREKYIFGQSEKLDRMEEIRIEQLRRELLVENGNAI
jgi:hypothetical protein